MNWFFTADEHYGHARIIEYCSRPWASVGEMDEELIARHNALVRPADCVLHVGDFAFGEQAMVQAKYIKRLAGKHVFVRGSHDRWLQSAPDIWEQRFGEVVVVACHYAMRVWPKSHYGSWQVYGHSHGKLPPIGKQHDVGVDANDFRPVSFDELVAIMAKRPDNPNLIRKRRAERKEDR